MNREIYLNVCRIYICTSINLLSLYAISWLIYLYLCRRTCAECKTNKSLKSPKVDNITVTSLEGMFYLSSNQNSLSWLYNLTDISQCLIIYSFNYIFLRNVLIRSEYILTYNNFQSGKCCSSMGADRIMNA